MTTKARFWCVFLDAYAFSSLVRMDPSSVTERLLRVHEQVYELVEEGRNAHSYIFSDSIFLLHPVDHDAGAALIETIRAIKKIISVGVEQKLIFRGSFAFGTAICSDKICVGEPVIRAVRLEQELKYPLTVVPLAEIEAAGLERSAVSLEFAPVRTKDGLIEAAVLIPNPVGLLLELVRQQRISAMKLGPRPVAKALVEFEAELDGWRSAANHARIKMMQG